MVFMMESARKLLEVVVGSELLLLLEMMVRSVNNGHMSNSKTAYVSKGKETSSSDLR